MLCFLLGLGSGYWAQPVEADSPAAVLQASGKTATTAGKSPVAAAQKLGLSGDELSTIAIFQATTPSVVNIANVQEVQSRNYFSMDMQKMPVGVGSGET